MVRSWNLITNKIKSDNLPTYFTNVSNVPESSIIICVFTISRIDS